MFSIVGVESKEQVKVTQGEAKRLSGAGPRGAE